MKVLVVDESTEVARQLGERFPAQFQKTSAENESVTIDVVGDYKEALAILEETARYDVVIIDPNPRGQRPPLAIQILEQLKGTSVVAIALTAAPTVANCVDCMRAGARDYISKVNRSMQELIDGLSNVIAKEPKSARTPDEDAAFVRTHYETLAARHHGQWIAVGGGALLAFDDTYEGLRDKVKDIVPLGPPKFWRMPPAWPEVES
jgi:CheY-like chemotaxis protein